MHPVEHLVYFSCALTPLFFKVLPQPHRAIVHLHPHGSTHFPFTQAPFHMKWRRLTPLCSQMHPLCFVFNLFHAAISPMAGHDGLTGEVGGGGYGHYLHHAHYEVGHHYHRFRKGAIEYVSICSLNHVQKWPGGAVGCRLELTWFFS